MRAVAHRRDGYTHDVEVDGRHTVVFDEPAGSGGTDLGPSPTRMLAAALAACTAITVEMYAGRKEWDLGQLEVEVDMDYDERGTPNRFAVTLNLGGTLSEEQLERIRVIAGKCPVHRTLAGNADVTITDRVVAL